MKLIVGVILPATDKKIYFLQVEEMMSCNAILLDKKIAEFLTET
jgi:hypothetical protein